MFRFLRNDKLRVKNCVSKNLTFPKKSHQRAKTVDENFENFTVFSVTPVFEL